jgi:succinate-semialdehyde dehydrogenase / glutarate-semialdehyde dehydrogenase
LSNTTTRYQGDLFIGGQWIDGQRESRIDVINPSDGAVITTVADASLEDAIAAVDAAEAALDSWAATAPRRRSDILRRVFELMIERTDDPAYLISLENGKSLSDARGEVAYAAEFFRWYSEEAVRILGELSVAPSGANRIMVTHQPIGVCLLVTPWNFPAAMATRKIAPALAAGCTTVLKPATATPLTAYAIANILAEAGVPGGVVNVVTTSTTSQLIDRLLEDPRVRKLSFTGSTEVGRALLRKAAENVVKCSMELGGNAPFIVLEGADAEKAIDGVMIAKMRNGGQACTAANRIYVHTSLHDDIANRLAIRFKELVVGPGTDPATQCGPLVDRASVDKVVELVTDARECGATVIVGGDILEREGTYYAPTVLAGVTADARLVAEEIFGPVAAIIPFQDTEEAIAAANHTEFGLAAYVYSGDLADGLRVAERLEKGMVAVNRGLVSDAAAPFGGVKQSGLGREGAKQGLLEYTEPKYIAVEW